jgi:hypothetical protein
VPAFADTRQQQQGPTENRLEKTVGTLGMAVPAIHANTHKFMSSIQIPKTKEKREHHRH